MYEKDINDRLKEYLKEYNLLPESQYGFRKNTHTQLAIATLYESIALNQKNHHLANLVGRDISKAFDKVWYLGLKHKITELQLPNCFENELCSFLDGRTIKIALQGKLSEEIALESGVPQGSILSPLCSFLTPQTYPNQNQAI